MYISILSPSDLSTATACPVSCMGISSPWLAPLLLYSSSALCSQTDCCFSNTSGRVIALLKYPPLYLLISHWIKVRFGHYLAFTYANLGNNIARFERTILLKKKKWSIVSKVKELVSFPPDEVYYFVLFRCAETKQKHNLTAFRESSHFAREWTEKFLMQIQALWIHMKYFSHSQNFEIWIKVINDDLVRITFLRWCCIIIKDLSIGRKNDPATHWINVPLTFASPLSNKK